jgi:hypothetical protein
MSRDIKQAVTVDLAGNLPQQSRVYEKALERMGQRGAQHLSGMARMSQIAGRGLDKLGNRYTGLISGATVALAVKQVGDLSERYTRLGINAGLGADKVDKLKQQVFEVSQAPDIRVDPSQMISAIEDIVEKTGDLDFAQNNIRNIGLAIQATGADGASVGAMLAEFQKQGITAPGEVLKVIDSLNEQGKAGAFTLKDLANLGPRVVSAYNATGRSGVQAMKEMGAALQVIRMGTGSSEMAATAFEATLRAMADPKKIKALKDLGGISVFDPEKLKEGKEQLRPINELMVEIVKASGGKQTNLSAVFDAEALRAFNTAAAEFQRTGTVESMSKFMQVSGDGTTTINDSARAAREFNSALTYLKSGWDEFASDNLTGPVQELADFLHSADKETVNLTLNTAKWGVGLLGAAVAGRKMFSLYKGAQALFGKGGKGAAGAATGMMGGGSPIPVYIVNGPGGLAGAAAAGAGGKGGVRYAPGSTLAGAPKSVLSRAGNALGAAGMLYGAWEIGDSIGTAISENFVQGTSFGDALGEGIAKTLAMFGNEEAKRAVAINERTAQEQKASMKIEIVGNTPARVREMESTGIDLDVDAGQTMWGY